MPFITNREYIVCNYDIAPHGNYLDYNVTKGKPENCPITYKEYYNNNLTCVS